MENIFGKYLQCPPNWRSYFGFFEAINGVLALLSPVLYLFWDVWYLKYGVFLYLFWGIYLICPAYYMYGWIGIAWIFGLGECEHKIDYREPLIKANEGWGQFGGIKPSHTPNRHENFFHDIQVSSSFSRADLTPIRTIIRLPLGRKRPSRKMPLSPKKNALYIWVKGGLHSNPPLTPFKMQQMCKVRFFLRLVTKDPPPKTTLFFRGKKFL